MTTWGVQQVGQWASAAGWKGDDLAYAVAVAMAGSNGADHIKVNPSYDVQLERRGLWLVRLLDMDEPQNVDLFDPVQNAAFAHAAWLERGQQWQWHPVVLSGAADDALDYVREALRAARPDVSPVPTMSFRERLTRFASFHDAMSATASNRGGLSA